MTKNKNFIKSGVVLILFSFILHFTFLHPFDNIIVFCKTPDATNVEFVNFLGTCEHNGIKVIKSSELISQEGCDDKELFSDNHDYITAKSRSTLKSLEKTEKAFGSLNVNTQVNSFYITTANCIQYSNRIVQTKEILLI